MKDIWVASILGLLWIKPLETFTVGQEEVKLSLFADDDILHIENPKDSTKKTVRTNKQTQYSCKIQNQHTEINCVSIHW